MQLPSEQNFTQFPVLHTPEKEVLVQYLLHLADNALILGHRNSEWTGHGPILEQDIAISNIALDLIGQARNFYQYAAVLFGQGITEDMLAFHRDGWDFRNCLLVEQSRGDWAVTVLRQFIFSNYQYLLFSALQNSTDS
ncbi:MAG TPA: 1,2-phenylacetyl-CoA epoxidase subunit PaaC, partial [Flavitalea sp.]|nr:1,2-phenylacetyl-CoA epoxidase subunit PaaC [Flavitalea sp.]